MSGCAPGAPFKWPRRRGLLTLTAGWAWVDSGGVEQLSVLDAGFLEVEDSDPHVSLAIGGVSIMEGPAPGFDEFVTAFAGRVQSIPRCRQVVRAFPFDLRPPEWVDDPHFDLARHLHRVALPHPGGDPELFEMIAALMEHRLDRERPLWDCWIIEGLSGNRWAVLTKIHHCVADGIATAQMLAKFADGYDEGDGGGSFVTSIHATAKVTKTGNPVRAALSWVRAAEHAVFGMAELTANLIGPAATTSLNGPVTTMRRYSAARVRLDDMRKVSRAFGVTLNDVALAAITSGYRQMLLDRGEQPSRDSLRTLVPVSVRSAGKLDVADNRVSAMLPLLPVDEEDPVEQLRLVHDRLDHAKGGGQSQGGSALVSTAQAYPFPVSAWAVRLLSRLPQRAVVALATNVPGPRARQTLMGRRVLEMLPIPPIALRLRTGIAMVSYAEAFAFGIMADYDTAPDIDALAAGIEAGLRHLVAAARARQRKRPVGSGR